jgi:DnaJ-class molecular chaperone
MGAMKNLQMYLEETSIMSPCPDCIGTGTIEVEFARPHGPDRDVGYLDTRTEVCETCSGDGEMERLCDCGSPVTMIMGRDAEVCMECADEDV